MKQKLESKRLKTRLKRLTRKETEKKLGMKERNKNKSNEMN